MPSRIRETGRKNSRMRFHKENCKGSAAGMKGLGNVQRENELRQSSIGKKNQACFILQACTGVKSLKNPAEVSTGIMFF